MTRFALIAIALACATGPALAASCGERPTPVKVPASPTPDQMQTIYKDLDIMRNKTTAYVACLNKEAYEAQNDYKVSNDAYAKAVAAMPK